MLIIYVPCGSEEEAEKISESLLDDRLIACANIYQSKSLYRWKGKLERSDEWIVFAKSSPEKFDEIERRVKSLHSYELPCIIGIPIQQSSGEYAKWVENSLS
jgi:periplasmic divalent cation tolerance protein